MAWATAEIAQTHAHSTEAALGVLQTAVAGLQLLAGVLAECNPDAEYIKLPKKLPLQLPPPLRTSTYVRKEYRKVIECMYIAEGGCTDLHSRPPQGSAAAATTAPAGSGTALPGRRVCVGTVLAGASGAGKSSILPFVLVHLARHKQTAVIRYQQLFEEQYILLDYSGHHPKVDIVYNNPYQLEGGEVHVSEQPSLPAHADLSMYMVPMRSSCFPARCLDI